MHGPRPIENTRPAPIASRQLVVLLVGVTSVGPLALNILPPAMPDIARAMRSTPDVVQLTLSLFLLGLAVSQLVLGPLSDRFGRRPVMLAGLALTVLASIAAFLATTMSWLIAARTIQALGASTGLVIGRAVIRDLYERDHAASMLGWVTMAMVVVPMVAPSIGGLLDTALGWRAIFVFIALFAIVILVWTARALPETRAAVPGDGPTGFLRESAALIMNRNFMGYALASAFGSATFFSFLGGAPHIVVTMMERSSAIYGLWFAISGLAYMSGNFIAARWSMRFGSDRMVIWGLNLGALGAVASLACALVFPPSLGPAIIFMPQMLLAIGNGFLLPNAIAGAVSARPEAAGAASGITGFLQMGLGAAAAQLTGYLLASAATPLPLTIMLALCAFLSLASYWLLARRQNSP